MHRERTRRSACRLAEYLWEALCACGCSISPHIDTLSSYCCLTDYNALNCRFSGDYWSDNRTVGSSNKKAAHSDRRLSVAHFLSVLSPSLLGIPLPRPLNKSAQSRSTPLALGKVPRPRGPETGVWPAAEVAAASIALVTAVFCSLPSGPGPSAQAVVCALLVSVGPSQEGPRACGSTPLPAQGRSFNVQCQHDVPCVCTGGPDRWCRSRRTRRRRLWLLTLVVQRS